MNTHSLGALALLFTATTAAAQWQQLTPASSPSARSGHGMATHPVTGNVMLFGGGALFSTFNETWSFDGSTWTQSTPPVSPPASVGLELVHDLGRGVVVMYGGVNTSLFGGPSVDQTWEFDGTTWTQSFPVTTPGGLGRYGASYDAVRGRVVIYGGVANSFFPIAEAGTWEWNGTNWALITTTGSPGALERPAMCYHAGINRTVLFGGIDPQIGGVDTTWLYDGVSWTAAPIAGSKPAVRSGARMAYDSLRGVCVLTGGVDPITGNAIVDTWEFDGLAWAQVPAVTSARYESGLAYLSSTRRVVQFGGINPVTFSDLGDTWDYSRARVIGNGCPGSNGVPDLAAVAGPRLGQNYVQNLTNLVPAVPLAVIVLGLSSITPTPLDGIGMFGCTAYVSPDVLLTVGASAGAASLVIAIPNTPSLAGLLMFSQGLSFDASANPAQLTASNALDGRVGS